MQLFIDGEWIEESQAKIAVTDLAVVRGFGIFDFLRTYGKTPFRLDDHIERFFNSAKLMGMKPKYSHGEIAHIAHEGIARNGLINANIKFIQTGGVSLDGFIPAAVQTFFMYFYPASVYPKEMFQEGISLQTSQLMRQLPLAKTINYAASIVEVQKAKLAGASDILHTTSEGDILEGTRSNFFAVKNGTIVTAQDGILFGITRKVILEIAKKLTTPVEYRPINVAELPSIDEAFVSSSTQEVMPVTTINGQTIGNGKPGKVTKQLMKQFKTLTEQI